MVFNNRKQSDRRAFFAEQGALQAREARPVALAHPVLTKNARRSAPRNVIMLM